tara:strand:+ start:176 stop:370 length:195 start_codon:yes stop_codon:yes gene_type:complete
MRSTDEHRNKFSVEALRLELDKYANLYNTDPEYDYDDLISSLYTIGYDMDIIEEVEYELRELLK